MEKDDILKKKKTRGRRGKGKNGEDGIDKKARGIGGRREGERIKERSVWVSTLISKKKSVPSLPL